MTGSNAGTDTGTDTGIEAARADLAQVVEETTAAVEAARRVRRQAGQQEARPLSTGDTTTTGPCITLTRGFTEGQVRPQVLTRFSKRA